jgi:hypothetical protein
VVERIGDLYYLFNLTPNSYFICDDNYSRGLRCYTDAEFGSYETGLAHRCDSTFVISREDRQPFLDLSIFPNPSQTDLYMHWEEAPRAAWSVDIFDSAGKWITSQAFPAGEGEAHWKLNEWLPGIYLVNVRLGNQMYSRKLVRE